MQIFVHNGRSHGIDVELSDTVYSLLTKCFDRGLGPIGAIRLLYGGKQLDPNRQLRSYEIIKASTIHLVHRSRLIRIEPPSQDRRITSVKVVV